MNDTDQQPVESAANAASQPQLLQSSSKQTLIWILVLGAVLRMVVWLAFMGADEHIVDAQDYDRLAVGLAETGRYITPSGELSSLRPPLYPWCVAIAYKLFGIQNYEPVRLAQALLSLVTVVMVYRLGSLVFTQRVGTLSAGLYCFYPSAMGFNNLILSETLFTFLGVLATWLVALSMVRYSLGALALAGIVLALGALTRSILWLYTPLLAVLLVLIGAGSLPKRLAGAGLLLAAFAITIAPWAYRNTILQKTFTPIDVMGGRNVMMGNYEFTPLERSWATIEIAKGEQSWIAVLIKEHGPLGELTQGQIDKLAMGHGIRFMLANPSLTLKRCLVRFFNFWQLDRTLVAGLRAGFWGQHSTIVLGILALVIMGYYALLAYAGIFGIAFAKPSDWRVHALLLFCMIFPCMVHTAIFAHSRYHVPLMPVVCIYAASAILSWRSMLWERPHYRLWIASALCLILSLAWIREIVIVDFARMGGT